MGAGGGAGGPGLYFQPYPDETEEVVIRKQGDIKHVCIRTAIKDDPVYLIVATVKHIWLAHRIAKLVRENLDGDWFAEEKG